MTGTDDSSFRPELNGAKEMPQKQTVILMVSPYGYFISLVVLGPVMTGSFETVV